MFTKLSYMLAQKKNFSTFLKVEILQGRSLIKHNKTINRKKNKTIN